MVSVVEQRIPLQESPSALADAAKGVCLLYWFVGAADAKVNAVRRVVTMEWSTRQETFDVIGRRDGGWFDRPKMKSADDANNSGLL